MRILVLSVLALLLSASVSSAQPADLDRSAAVSLIALDPAAFEQAWDPRHKAALKATPEARDRAALTAQWAQGYLDYEFFRWREVGAAFPVEWPARDAALQAVERNNVALLDLPAHRAFLDVWIRAEVRRLLRAEPAHRVGNVVWLETAFDVVEGNIDEPAVRDALLGQALLTFIDESGAKGVGPLLERFARTAVDAAAVSAVRQAYEAEQATETGHPVEPYKTIGPVDLAIHIFRPPGAPAQGAPAVVWFHGGSGDTGAWNHCPAFCRRFAELGIVVLQVEYRTNQRFDSMPLDALADARSAVRWTRSNAGRLGLDPNRIAVAGFSTGATLAAQTLVVDGFDDPGDDLAVSVRPNAAILVSGCYEPESDAYFRRVMEGQADLARLSPAALSRPGLPPTLAIHGEADRVCEIEPARRLIDAMDGGGRLVALAGQPHHFVFSAPAARAEALEATAAFLMQAGWTR